MIKIRLSKKGAKNSLFYRIVAANERSKATGKYVDLIGYFDPVKDRVKINKEKLNKWVSQGARLTKRVQALVEKK